MVPIQPKKGALYDLLISHSNLDSTLTVHVFDLRGEHSGNVRIKHNPHFDVRATYVDSIHSQVPHQPVKHLNNRQVKMLVGWCAYVF